MFGPPKSDEWEGKMTKISQFKNNSSNEEEQSELSRMLFDFSFPETSSIAMHERIPGGISIRIENDTSISDIHQVLRSLFINGRRDSSLDICSKLTEELWGIYYKNSIIIINKYVGVMTDKTKGIFIREEKQETYDEIKYRIELINDYITVVESLDILEINYYYSHEISNVCPICNSDIFSNHETDSDGRLICKCGYVVDDPFIADDQLELSECDIIKATPDILTPFNKWLNRYLGISDGKIKDEAYADIFYEFDKICVKEGWPTGEDVRSGNYEHPDINRLLRLMRDSGNSYLYKNKNIVRHKYWGWTLPILTDEQKSQVRRSYILFQSAYPKYSKRKQKINNEINGYQLLRSAGHMCYISDFKIPNNPSTISYANEVSQQVCDHIKILFFSVGV